jgi:protein-tyrosine kinase
VTTHSPPRLIDRLITTPRHDAASTSGRLPLRTVALDRSKGIGNGIVGLDPHDPRTRSFLILRSQLRMQFYRPGGRVLIVTSTEPGNGKTYTSANLACAIAAIQPCVLVDLDLRRPSLATQLGIEVRQGTDDLLAGEATFEEVGVSVEGLALTLFPARSPRPESSTLLAGERLGRFVSALRELPGSPICIIDMPPVLILDDVMLVVRSVDGVLMVVEEGRTRRSDLREALGMFGSTPLVGSVLNKSLAGSRSYDVGGYYGPSGREEVDQ